MTNTILPTIIEMMQDQGVRIGSQVRLTLSRDSYLDEGWRIGKSGRETPGFRPFWPGTTDHQREKINTLKVGGIVEKIEDTRIIIAVYQGDAGTILNQTIPRLIYIHNNVIGDFEGEDIRKTWHERRTTGRNLIKRFDQWIERNYLKSEELRNTYSKT